MACLQVKGTGSVSRGQLSPCMLIFTSQAHIYSPHHGSQVDAALALYAPHRHALALLLLGLRGPPHLDLRLSRARGHAWNAFYCRRSSAQVKWLYGCCSMGQLHSLHSWSEDIPPVRLAFQFSWLYSDHCAPARENFRPIVSLYLTYGSIFSRRWLRLG